MAYGVRATGSVIRFDGFLKIYEEGTTTRIGEDGAACPRSPQAMRSSRARSRPSSISPSRRRATPKRRSSRRWRSSASAGRRPMPRRSTCCATANMCGSTRSGSYPEDKGRLVTAFLESFFSRYVEYDFTADLEEKLDQISAGELAWKDVLRDFWRDFIAAVNDIEDLRDHRGARCAERVARAAHLPGPRRRRRSARMPELRHRRLVSSSASSAPSSAARTIPTAASPASSPMQGEKAAARRRRQAARHRSRDRAGCDARTGRFGPYVQLGEQNGKEKPKRAWIPKGAIADSLDLDAGAHASALPRESASIRRPASRSRRLRPLRAVRPARRQIRQPRASTRCSRSASTAPCRCSPRRRRTRAPRGAQRRSRSSASIPTRRQVQVRDGRYGPYVNHGKINATCPRTGSRKR